jgi:hypothetical protein
MTDYDQLAKSIANEMGESVDYAELTVYEKTDSGVIRKKLMINYSNEDYQWSMSSKYIAGE